MLDEDPDLGDAVDLESFALLRATAIAPLIEVRAGRWPPMRPPGDPVFGLLVLALEGRTKWSVLFPRR